MCFISVGNCDFGFYKFVIGCDVIGYELLRCEKKGMHRERYIIVTLAYSIVNIAFVNEIRVFQSVSECRIIKS